MRFGERGDGTGDLDGHIAQTIVFNRELTSTEISTLYNSGDGITYRELFALSDDLEAYYKLDGDATDATGNGNNGTVNGATSGAQGIVGEGYTFSGNDSIDTGITPTFTDITVFAWMVMLLMLQETVITEQ